MYAATCAPVRKPEEARRPGSVLEEPYPVKTHDGERRRGGLTRGVLPVGYRG